MSENHDLNVMLCRQIQKHPCVYDTCHPDYPEFYDTAWETIANKCHNTVTSCKVRWGHIRTSFVRSVLAGQKPSYIHKEMQFYRPFIKGTVQTAAKLGSDYIDSGDEGRDNCDLPLEMLEEVSELQTNEINDPEETSSAEETIGEEPDVPDQETFESKKSRVQTFIIKQKPTKVGTFIADDGPQVSQNEDDELSDSKSASQLDDGGRNFRFQRACKRGLDKTTIMALSEKEGKDISEPKRSRCIVEQSIEKPVRLPCVRKDAIGIVSKGQNKLKLILTPPARRVEKEKEVPQLETKKATKEKDQPSDRPNDTIETQTKPQDSDEHFTAVEDWFKKFEGAKVFCSPIKSQSKPKNPCTKTAKDEATQCSLITSEMDNDFLNSLKPEMALMNSRQKLHFKKKVYQSLMEVFDDAAIFADSGCDTSLDQSSPRLNSTSEELHLMRELVALVQAAKMSPEVATTVATEEVPANSNENKAKNTTNETATEASDPLHLPGGTDDASSQRRIITKVVKLSDNGDKQRFFRIYPKGTIPTSQSVSSSGVRTFIIPRTPTTASNPTNSTPRMFIPTSALQIRPSSNGTPSSGRVMIRSRMGPASSVIVSKAVPSLGNSAYTTIGSNSFGIKIKSAATVPPSTKVAPTTAVISSGALIAECGQFIRSAAAPSPIPIALTCVNDSVEQTDSELNSKCLSDDSDKLKKLVKLEKPTEDEPTEQNSYEKKLHKETAPLTIKKEPLQEELVVA